MQAGGVNTSLDPAEVSVAAPLEAAWESIRTGLRRDLGVRTFDGWLKPAELGSFEPDSGTLDVVMPSQFMADWVRSHFGERLTLAWKTVLPVVREGRCRSFDPPGRRIATCAPSFCPRASLVARPASRQREWRSIGIPERNRFALS